MATLYEARVNKVSYRDYMAAMRQVEYRFVFNTSLHSIDCSRYLSHSISTYEQFV